MNKICIIGDVLLDVSLKNKKQDLKMRLGGIIHSARALWAFDVQYSLAFISPNYLDYHIENYTKEIGEPQIQKIGNIINSPYVILIDEVKEIGDQGYEFLLRDDIKIEYINNYKLEYDNYLIVSGNYDLGYILKKIEDKNVSIELANMSIDELSKLKFKFKNIYVSTSSLIFKEFIKSNDFNFSLFTDIFKGKCENLIFKENRGGTRLFRFEENRIYQTSSQTRPIQHSVGVGDVFNLTFELNIYDTIDKNLAISSFVAAEYASTTFPVDFKESVKRLLKTKIDDLVNIKGAIVNWEKRKSINIYIAAPDFDFVDTHFIDLICEKLEYHNFSPRRPITENGQIQENDSIEIKRDTYIKDYVLINECTILIAVLLYNDPGTLVEIGIASEKKIPVILYDPYNIAKNCMLLNTCDFVSDDLDEIISTIFNISSKYV